MRKMTVATVMLLALLALAAKGEKGDKEDTAVAAVKATLDKVDEAFNRGDAKAIAALLDKSLIYAGPFISSRGDTVDAARTEFEQTFANGPIGKLTRNDTTVHVGEDGKTAWYIAEYMFVPKVGPGVLPVHRKIRESGVLVRHGKEWKLAMYHDSYEQPDPPKPAATPAK